MSSQSQFQRGEQMSPLLAQGREIATNTAKGLRARQTAEAAGNLLLNFHHSDIAFGLRIGPSRQLHGLHL